MGRGGRLGRPPGTQPRDAGSPSGRSQHRRQRLHRHAHGEGYAEPETSSTLLPTLPNLQLLGCIVPKRLPVWIDRLQLLGAPAAPSNPFPPRLCFDLSILLILSISLFSPPSVCLSLSVCLSVCLSSLSPSPPPSSVHPSCPMLLHVCSFLIKGGGFSREGQFIRHRGGREVPAANEQVLRLLIHMWLPLSRRISTPLRATLRLRQWRTRPSTTSSTTGSAESRGSRAFHHNHYRHCRESFLMSAGMAGAH